MPAPGTRGLLIASSSFGFAIVATSFRRVGFYWNWSRAGQWLDFRGNNGVKEYDGDVWIHFGLDGC